MAERSLVSLRGFETPAGLLGLFVFRLLAAGHVGVARGLCHRSECLFTYRCDESQIDVIRPRGWVSPFSPRAPALGVKREEEPVPLLSLFYRDLAFR